MAKELFCVDCYADNDKPLRQRCLDECDGHGPMAGARKIAELRKARKESDGTGTQGSQTA